MKSFAQREEGHILDESVGVRAALLEAEETAQDGIAPPPGGRDGAVADQGAGPLVSEKLPFQISNGFAIVIVRFQ